MLFDKLYPTEYIKSTYDIDFEKYYQEGYRSVIFDVDNTLVPHGAPADNRALALFKKLHKLGFATLLLSNNKEPRVKPFADATNSLYIFKAGKPGKKNYILAMDKLGTNIDNTIFIGDQLFTDVWGANNAGIHSILVAPIHPKEEIQIVLKRILEKAVLFFYFKGPGAKYKK